MNNKIDKNSETYRDKDFFDKLWKDEMKYRRQKNKYSYPDKNNMGQEQDKFNKSKP